MTEAFAVGLSLFLLKAAPRDSEINSFVSNFPLAVPF